MRDLLLLLLVMRRRQNRRQRRVWVHETLQTRDDRGEFHILVRELHSYDDRFFEYFRMSQAQFAHILSILKPSITKQTTKFRQPRSDVPKNLQTLRHFAFWCPRYASLPASGVTGCGMTTTTKQKRWLVKSTAGERYPAGKSLPQRSSAVPLRCHAKAKIKIADWTSGISRDIPLRILPNVNGPLWVIK